jgi:hypothetical protein
MSKHYREEEVHIPILAQTTVTSAWILVRVPKRQPVLVGRQCFNVESFLARDASI